MSTNKAKALLFAAIISIFPASAALGQVTSQISGGRDQSTPDQAIETAAREQRILDSAGSSFKKGIESLSVNDRSGARKNFNESIESFLVADLKTQRLRTCYEQLVENIYRLEYPSDQQQPMIAELASEGSCRLAIEPTLASTVTMAALASVKENPSEGQRFPAAQGGFTEQKHEVSPLDELAKLELSADELNTDSDAAQQQFRFLEDAVSKNSLGLTFQVHPMIQQFINYYQGRGRTTMATGLYRSGMFMRMARRIFRENGIPENIAWLAQVESTWKPTAMSWAAASGLWQFIPGTGERYGLRRTAYVDERNSFEKATTAAAQYLRFLANRYNGNWELALAAYNSGEGNVDRAISRAGVANFWQAFPYLPQETRNYVPSILATIIIANNPSQYGFGQVRPADPLVYDQVKVPASTDLAFIAQAADTTVLNLRYLNPELRSNMTPPEPFIVRVPWKKGGEVVAMFKKLPSGMRGDASVVAGMSGESWQTISNKTGVSIEALRAANPGMTVPQGKVIVPVSANVTRTAYQRPATPSASTKGAVRAVKVKKGDTLTKIASQYGVTPSELANLNGLSSVDAPLQVGKDLKIPVK